MAKLKDTTIYGSLDVIKDIRKNSKDVATEDFVEDFVTEQGFLKKDGSVSIEKATSTGDSASKELKFDIKHVMLGDMTKNLKASALGYLEYDEEVLFSKVQVPATGNVITGLTKSADTIKVTKDTFIKTTTKGTVTTGDPGTNADVSVTNSNGVATFNFTIPQGPQGLPGLPGQPGQPGEQGPPGADGKGWTSGTYTPSTGKISFTSNDAGYAFTTDDLRGSGIGVSSKSATLAGGIYLLEKTYVSSASPIKINDHIIDKDGKVYKVTSLSGQMLLGGAAYETIITNIDLTGPKGADGIDGTDGVAGTDGKDLQFKWGTLIEGTQYKLGVRQQGQSSYIYGDSLRGAQGETGQNIKLRKHTNDYIQWAVANSSSWTNLISLDDITGPQGPQGLAGPQGLQGEQGPPGVDGIDGTTGAAAGFGTPTYNNTEANAVGTAAVEVTSSGPDTAKIFNFKFKNLKGATGAAGAKGTTFTPSVNASGVISWTNDGGLLNPTSRDIKGPQGEQGPPGVDGTDATVTKANIDTALSYATGSTRLGISAGTSSTGNNNTLFGNSAGSSLTTGSSNTYIGFESGASNKTSYQNVAIGYQALKLGTSSSNVAIGYQAAHKITSGNDNIILGRNSGESITTSLRNIAIGSFALGKIASSSYIKNIGIGYDAGRFKENGTSSLSAANNSIYIGDSTKGSTSSGNNNEIVIGTNAIGKGSNTVQLGSSDITTGYIGNKTIATEEYVDSKEVVLPSNLIRQTNWNSSTKTLIIEVLS